MAQCDPTAFGVSLQRAYDAGNTILTDAAGNIDFTLASGLTTSFSLTNAGTGPASIINDTNASTNTSLEIQHACTNTLTIDENGNLTTSGNIATTGTGTITSACALTVSSGGASVTGGINNNSGSITSTGAITGATNITASGKLYKQMS